VTPRPLLRVLLVDDDPDLLRLLEAVLAGSSLEIVGVASNGEDGVRVASTMAPDIAVVDYMMPGIDGLETARRIKTLLPDCRIVVFSALDMDAEATADPHVDHFVRKSEVLELDALLLRIGSEYDPRRGAP
jgi:CheY-like chemotaxis protein